jgi:hypothetical protein
MRMIHFAAILVTVAVGVAPKMAHAERYWTSIGNGCVPTDNTLTANIMDSRGFGVGFRGTSTGTIDLFCPVTIDTTGSAPTLGGIHMSYRDSDGSGTKVHITADFRQATDGSNSSSSLCTADSNTNSATGYTTWSCGFFPSVIPATNKSYWVEVQITRTTATDATCSGGSCDPELLSVWVD